MIEYCKEPSAEKGESETQMHPPLSYWCASVCCTEQRAECPLPSPGNSCVLVQSLPEWRR